MSKKNQLEFDRGQPAFLQRLRGQIVGSSDGDPDRHVNPVARPKRAKRLDAEEDDGPTYVMEDTNATLTKDEYEALVKEKEGTDDVEKEGAAKKNGAEIGGEDGVKGKQKLGAIGGMKKRKAAKVIGADEADGEKDESKSFKPEKEGDQKSKESEKKPPKKKKAKVNLNFGDDGEP